MKKELLDLAALNAGCLAYAISQAVLKGRYDHAAILRQVQAQDEKEQMLKAARPGAARVEDDLEQVRREQRARIVVRPPLENLLFHVDQGQAALPR